MDFVVTLIANPEKEALTAAVADSMATSLGAQGKPVWLKEHTACDLFVKHDRHDALAASARELIGDKPYDAIVQPVAGRRKKLLVADMESTIITCECLDELAVIAGIGEKIAGITARAMNGELDFEAALRERVGLLKGLPESNLLRVMEEKAEIMPGAQALVATMRENGAYCMLVSGGFDFYTSRVKNMLGFHEDRSNRLEIRDGRLTGNVIAPVLGKEAKLAALQETCRRFSLSAEETLAVGDGANDLPMLLAAGLGVAYHAKPSVRAAAQHTVNHGDLTALLFAQGYKEADWK